MDLSDAEKIKILIHVLKKYASLLNWASGIDDEGKVTYTNKWLGEGHGYELARQALNIVSKGNESTSKN